MFFYAFEHTYGVNTRDTNGNRIGCVLAFSNKRNRDKFINENEKAETISSKTARRHMLDYVAAHEFCKPSDLEFNATELVCRYNKALQV